MNLDARLRELCPPDRLRNLFEAHAFEPPFPSVENREAWECVRSQSAARCDQLVSAAMATAGEPIPPIPATLYLDFKRTGRRRDGQRPFDQRRARLAKLALAECLEGDGRFLDPILDLAWAICEESSWCRPAHAPDLVDPEDPDVDLFSATTAFELAEIDALLGARLDPAVSRRIRYEARRRCFDPYLARDDFHWMFSRPGKQINNWAAVCSGSIVSAAIYLERDPSRLTALVSKAMRSLDDYIAGFDIDGATSEGSFCWAYGFGYFTMLAHLLECRSGGQIDIWNERTRRIAAFPLHTQIATRRFVNFSDCEIGFTHIPAHLAFLAQRLDIPDLGRIAAHQPPNDREGQWSWGLRSLVWLPDLQLDPFVPALHDWFRGVQWMLSRQQPENPDAIVLASKGGHNDEMHNQNDVGHFTVDAWGEPLLVDLGKGVFDRKYFQDKGGRYELLVNSSTGHSVPVVNGRAQLYGAEHRAVLCAHVHTEREDRLELDISPAYPNDAGLESLTRLIRLDRDSNLVEIHDKVRFAETPGDFESVLVTLNTVGLSLSGAVVRGGRGDLEIRAEPRGVEIAVDEILDLELENRMVCVRRLRFRLPEHVREGHLRLWIRPVPRDTA